MNIHVHGIPCDHIRDLPWLIFRICICCNILAHDDDYHHCSSAIHPYHIWIFYNRLVTHNVHNDDAADDNDHHFGMILY